MQRKRNNSNKTKCGCNYCGIRLAGLSTSFFVQVFVVVNIIISLATLFIVAHDRMREQDEEETLEPDPEFLSKDLDSRLRELQTRRFGVMMDPKSHFRHVDKKEK